MTLTRSAEAKSGVHPIPKPERQPKGRKREHTIYVYGHRHPEVPVCWFIPFVETPCAGQLEHAHLIDQQTLRKLGLGRFLGDAAVWEWACRRHHFGFDSPRVFVPRSALSQETERFAAAHGLVEHLDRRYGERNA
jgi:hypothetical protein